MKKSNVIYFDFNRKIKLPNKETDSLFIFSRETVEKLKSIDPYLWKNREFLKNNPSKVKNSDESCDYHFKRLLEYKEKFIDITEEDKAATRRRVREIDEKYGITENAERS